MKIRKTQRHYGKESMKLFIQKKASKTNNPSSLLIHQKSVTNQQGMAEHFNNFFTSIGKNLQEINPLTMKDYPQYLKTPSKSNFSIKPIKSEEICDIIKTLKNSKNTGPNSIPTKILKTIKTSISTSLSTLINNFFANRTFPNICKIAKVVPVFKNESRLLCNNCRPISLLSNIGKIIEKLMHQLLNQFLEDNECFYPDQFGFRLNISTNNTLCPTLKTFKPDWMIINLLHGYL